jgi:ATP-dependent Clp protease ATP-binding subunit ClpA
VPDHPIISQARQEAVRCRAAAVDPVHLLFAILQDGRGAAHEILRELQVNPERVRQELEWGMAPAGAEAPPGLLPISGPTKAVVERAGGFATRFGQPAIGSEHLLLALCHPDAGVAGAVLSKLGVTEPKIVELFDAGDR